MTRMYPSEIKHPILRAWLAGTTCHNYWIGRSVLFENQEYIVLKHNSHATYTDRFSGTNTCAAHASLYRKTDLDPATPQGDLNLRLGSGEIAKWTGRIAASKVRDDCRDMGIEF